MSASLLYPGLAGIGPLGTPELIILGILLAIVAAIVGGIVLLIVLLTKKKK